MGSYYSESTGQTAAAFMSLGGHRFIVGSGLQGFQARIVTQLHISEHAEATGVPVMRARESNPNIQNARPDPCTCRRARWLTGTDSGVVADGVLIPYTERYLVTPYTNTGCTGYVGTAKP